MLVSNHLGGNDWTVKAVSRIVNNRFYTGVIEMGKTENTLGGMKPFINKNQQDWITIDNHHEAIVEIETFEKVQDTIEAKKDKRLNTATNIVRNNDTVNLSQISKINKLLYCGDCGRKMKKQVWGSHIYYVCPKYSETKGACTLKSWRLDRIINSLVRELEEQVVILESKLEICDLSENFTEQILLFQNEIDQLQLKRELIYDAFMESNAVDGKKLRSDLDLLEDRIKSSENKKDEIVHLDSKQRQVRDQINLLKLVVEELKDPQKNNKTDNDSILKLECVIKRIHVFDNKLDIEN